MSEYLIQSETLTGIADKIRPLLGLTGTMTPEQMQTNLTTEQANIAAALAALTEKGVEVPEGANSNALAGLIAAIEAGGGWFRFGKKTFASAILSTTLDFRFPVGNDNGPPEIFVIVKEVSGTNKDSTSNSFFCGIAAPDFLPGVYVYCVTQNGARLPYFVSNNYAIYTDSLYDGDYMLARPFSMPSFNIKEGDTIAWFAIGGVT